VGFEPTISAGERRVNVYARRVDKLQE